MMKTNKSEPYEIRDMKETDIDAVVNFTVDSWKLEYQDIIDKDTLTNFPKDKWRIQMPSATR